MYCPLSNSVCVLFVASPCLYIYNISPHICHVYCLESICVYMYSIVSSTVQDGFSPLYVASQEGHSQIVDILLLKGADPNLTLKVCVLVWSLYLLHV